jgi:hypothetical protein
VKAQVSREIETKHVTNPIGSTAASTWSAASDTRDTPSTVDLVRERQPQTAGVDKSDGIAARERQVSGLPASGPPPEDRSENRLVEKYVGAPGADKKDTVSRSSQAYDLCPPNQPVQQTDLTSGADTQEAIQHQTAGAKRKAMSPNDKHEQEIDGLGDGSFVQLRPAGRRADEDVLLQARRSVTQTSLALRKNEEERQEERIFSVEVGPELQLRLPPTHPDLERNNGCATNH